MRKLRLLISLIATIGLSIRCQAQEIELPATNGQVVYPEVGKPMPNLTFKDNWDRSEASISLLKGHWVILNLWSLSCTGCIANLPKDNELANAFGDQLRYILIGYQDRNKDIQKTYGKYKKKFGFRMRSVYDSILFDYWGISGVPVIIIVNPDGIVKAVTNELTKNNFAKVIKGESPMLISIEGQFDRKTWQNSWNRRDSSVLRGWKQRDNTSNLNLYNCTLKKYDTAYNYPSGEKIGQMLKSNGRVQITGASLADLYNVAYFDKIKPGLDPKITSKIYPFPIFNVKDSSVLILNFPSQGYYSVSIDEPHDKVFDPEVYQVRIANILDDYFKFKSSRRLMQVPYYKLVVRDSGLLSKHKTAGGESKVDEIGGFKITYLNVSLAKILYSRHVRYFSDSLPFIDETNVKYNVDITIEGLNSDFDEFRKGLQKNGLDLILAHKEMEVVYVEDAK